MKTNEIIEGNKLIAEFMGYKLASCNNGMAWESQFKRAVDDKFKIHGRLFYPSNHQYYRSGNYYLKFHSSWDWLMPVVEKIETMGYEVLIGRISCNINEILNRKNPIISFVCGDVGKKIDIVYEAVLAFINWYNTNQNDKDQ